MGPGPMAQTRNNRNNGNNEACGPGQDAQRAVSKRPALRNTRRLSNLIHSRAREPRGSARGSHRRRHTPSRRSAKKWLGPGIISGLSPGRRHAAAHGRVLPCTARQHAGAGVQGGGVPGVVWEAYTPPWVYPPWYRGGIYTTLGIPTMVHREAYTPPWVYTT